MPNLHRIFFLSFDAVCFVVLYPDNVFRHVHQFLFWILMSFDILSQHVAISKTVYIVAWDLY